MMKFPFRELRKKHFGIIFVLIFLIAVSTLCLSYFRAIRLEPIQSWSLDLKADCAIALTGGAGRVKEGLALLAQHKVKKLIVSGVHPNARLREIFPNWTVSGDLSEQDVILERWSSTTYGNAQQSLPLVEALRCQDILLVTSKIHMNRAYQTFVAAFPSAIPIYKYSIVASREESTKIEIIIEVFKSVFYALWAY